MIIIILALLTNLIISFFVAGQGKFRKIGYTKSFWISFLFSPIIGLLMVGASLPLSENEINAAEIENKKEKEKITTKWILETIGWILLFSTIFLVIFYCYIQYWSV